MLVSGKRGEKDGSVLPPGVVDIQQVFHIMSLAIVGSLAIGVDLCPAQDKSAGRRGCGNGGVL